MGVCVHVCRCLSQHPVAFVVVSYYPGEQKGEKKRKEKGEQETQVRSVVLVAKSKRQKISCES